MSTLGGLGDVISSAFTGAPVQRETAFAEGLLRSAQTESAVSQARERRATAQAKERENAKIATLADDLIAADPSMDPAVARTIAAGAGAGLGNLDQLAQGRNAIESGARRRLIADPNTAAPASSAARAAEMPGSYQQQRVEGGMLLDDATHTPTVTPVGQANIDADRALADQRGRAGTVPKFQRGAGGVLYVQTGDPANPLRLATPIEEQQSNAAAITTAQGNAKTTVELTKMMPKAKAAMRELENDYKEVGQLVTSAAQDPNLWQTAGLSKKISEIPGTEGTRLRSIISTLKYRLGFSALQNMRQLSPTGGALGNVSNAEGEWLQQSIAPLSFDMSVGDLREALNTVGQFTVNASGRRRQAYNEQFAGIDPEIQVTGAPAAPGLRPAVAPMAPQAQVFKAPPVNNKGWKLHTDAEGNQAYVGPNNEIEEL